MTITVSSKAALTTTRVELVNLSSPNNIDDAVTVKVMAFHLTSEPVLPDPTAYRQYAGLPLVASFIMDLAVTGKEKVVTMRMKKNDVGTWTFGTQAWTDVVTANYTMLLANPAVGETQIWGLRTPAAGCSTRCTCIWWTSCPAMVDRGSRTSAVPRTPSTSGIPRSFGCWSPSTPRATAAAATWCIATTCRTRPRHDDAVRRGAAACRRPAPLGLRGPAHLGQHVRRVSPSSFAVCVVLAAVCSWW